MSPTTLTPPPLVSAALRPHLGDGWIDVETYHAAGIALRQQLHYEQGLSALQAAYRLNPEARGLDASLSLSLARMGDTEAALAHAAAGLAFGDAADHEARYGAAVLALMHGRFNAGWPLYEARKLRAGGPYDNAFFESVRDLPEFAVVGSYADNRARLAGLRLLAIADQGLGDQIMFASLVPEILAAGANLTLACDQRLHALFTRSFPGVTCISDRGHAGWTRSERRIDGYADAWDMRALLGDFARWLRPGFASFPGTAYLKPLAARAAVFRALYRDADMAGDRLRVGISWRTPGTMNKSGDQKTVPLSLWKPIADAAERETEARAWFVSLQYRDPREFELMPPAAAAIHPYKDWQLDPWRDVELLADQIAALDLVITSSNVTAHLAGALGVPTVVMVPRGMGHNWHWFLPDTKPVSPWYGSVTVLQQETRGDWTKPIEGAAAILRRMVEEKRS